MFSAGPRGLDLCTKAVMPKVRGYLLPQTQILSFTVLPTAPPPSRCQFASLYQGFPFQVAFWIKAAVGSIQGSKFRHCGSVRVQRSLPASRSPRTTEKTAMWSFKPVSKGTLLKFRFSQDWLLLWVAIGRYWAEEWLKKTELFPGSLCCLWISTYHSALYPAAVFCRLVGKLIIALSAGFTPSPSSLTISSVPPALLPDSSLARWTLPADPGSHLHGHSIAVNKTRPGCLHTNVNKVTVYHLKAVSGSACVWLGMEFSVFSQRSPRLGWPKSVSSPSPTLVPWPCWACHPTSCLYSLLHKDLPTLQLNHHFLGIT